MTLDNANAIPVFQCISMQWRKYQVFLIGKRKTYSSPSIKFSLFLLNPITKIVSYIKGIKTKNKNKK